MRPTKLARRWILASLFALAGCGSDSTCGDGGGADLAARDLAAMRDGSAAGDLAGSDLATSGDLASSDRTMLDLQATDAAPVDLSVPDLTMPDLAMPDLLKSDLVCQGMSCGSIGAPCCSSAGCCSGYCDSASATCAFPSNLCAAKGASCTKPTDCCGLLCAAGKCGGACTVNGAGCGGNGECCSGNCTGGMCQPVVAGCITEGNTCAMNSDCCTSNCQGGRCVLAGGGCQVIGDVCYSGSDCCSGKCTIPNGMVAGTCTQIGNGGCVLDGEVCPGCSQCCSRVCGPTATGGNVCQQAGGCRLLGDLCHQDTDCCGGPQTAQSMCSVGEVTCTPIANTNPPVGQCSQPGSNGCGTCNPEGDVCGIKPVQACSGSAREDCCDCISPKFNCCKFDRHGVARCFGGSTTTCPTGFTGVAPCCIDPYQWACSNARPCPSGNTCVNGACQGPSCSNTNPCPTGQACINGFCPAQSTCTFSDECCGGTPCVPDQNGVLRCQAACQASGAKCTATSDCCTGLVCAIPTGQLLGSCTPTQPSGPVADGGASDGGSQLPDLSGPPPDLICPQLGQSCSTTLPCCAGSSLACTEPGGIVSCKGGDTNCSCTGIIM
jgi:hypothetical protein